MSWRDRREKRERRDKGQRVGGWRSATLEVGGRGKTVDLRLRISDFKMVLYGGEDEGTHLDDADHRSEFVLFTCRTLAKTLGPS